MNQKKVFLLALISAATLNATAQDNDTYDEQATTLQKKGEFEYSAEAQGSFSHGKTPLWLNANKYGLSSLDENNGYIRGSLQRSIGNDMEKKWGYGFGVDAAVPFNYTSNVVLQQAYVEGRWLHGTLSIGAKERPMNLKNNRLSSGSQTLGINARPVPQVRLALEDYWKVPFTAAALISFLLGTLMVLYAVFAALFRNSRKGIWFSGLGTVLVVLSLFWVAGYNDTPYYPSYADMESSLTIYNSSSSEFTLKTMSVVSLAIPFVLAYIAWVWYKLTK